MKMTKLSPEALQNGLRTIPSWQLADGMLVREWTFQNFADAMIFVNHAAELAEELDHHPNIDIRYNKVRLALTSHDADGLTTRDLRYAAGLDAQMVEAAESDEK